jgi:hypothetical protein
MGGSDHLEGLVLTIFKVPSYSSRVSSSVVLRRFAGYWSFTFVTGDVLS